MGRMAVEGECECKSFDLVTNPFGVGLPFWVCGKIMVKTELRRV